MDPERARRIFGLSMFFLGCAGFGADDPIGAEQATAASRCRGVAANTARLTCYDAVFGKTSAAPPAATPNAPIALQFGDVGQLRGDSRLTTVAPSRLDATVRSAEPLAHGLFRLTLDNTQVWDTREANWALEFHSGDTVTISRMALGGYQVSMAGRAQSVGTRRVR